MKDLYFAACSADGGIYHYKLCEGNLEFIRKYDIDRPMYLAIEGDKMYVILRDVYDGMSAVSVFDIDKDGNLYNMTIPVSTRGKCACHLCVEDGKVYTANYLSGTVSLVGSKTVAHTGCGPNKPRQDMPHCHYVNFTADKKHLLVCDLGNDTVYTYDRDLCEISKSTVPQGHGCRHLVMSKKHNVVYCVNELESTVTVFDIDDGVLTAGQTVGALTPSFNGKSTAAAIRLSEDEKYLYVSNRGEDSICVFEISESGRKLSQKNNVSCGGVSPRDFDIVDGIMFVTNEQTNNVTVFEVNGKDVIKTECELDMPNPLCVVYK